MAQRILDQTGQERSDYILAKTNRMFAELYGTRGTFTANGVSAVTVAEPAVLATSRIVITLLTVGGTVGAIPAVKTKTAGTGFTVAGTASDTSVYTYVVYNDS